MTPPDDDRHGSRDRLVSPHPSHLQEHRVDLQDDSFEQDPILRQALEVDRQHREQLDALATSRRGALKAAAGGLFAVVGAGALVGAGTGVAGAAESGGGGGGTGSNLPRLGTPADKQLMAFLQSVSTAVAEVYRQLLAKAVFTSPQLEVITIFARHHVQTGDTWDATLGTESSRTPNGALLAQLQPRVNTAATARQALELMFELEGNLVATLLSAVGQLEAPFPAQNATAMLVPAAQRQVVIGQELGRDAGDFLPTFETTAAAYTPAQFPLS
jgi:hypothetical protein